MAAWVEQMCNEYELDKQDIASFQKLSGAALHRLKRSDWIERSSEQGDVLYNLWSDMITPKQAEKTLPEGKAWCFHILTRRIVAILYLAQH